MSDAHRKQSSGLSLTTLLIAGAASATAAFVVPMFWQTGTVFAAAMSPIIVAVVTELLKKPVDTVSAVTARTKSGARFTTTRSAVRVPDREDAPFDPLAPAPTEELQALPPRTTTQRAVHRRRRLTGRQWKLALLTGLAAFACVAVLFTVTELVAGDPVTRDTGRTTFFGGRHRDSANDDKDTGKQDKDKQEATPTPTPSATPTPTPTPSPSPVPTATPTPTPTPGIAPAVPAPQAAPPEATPTPVP